MKVFIIKVTDRCNLDCNYCYYKNTEGDINKKLIKRLIEETKKLEDNKITFIYHGGEPLLLDLEFYRYILKLQNKIDKEFKNKIQTNGTCFNKKNINFLKKNNFEIGISLDGYKSIHSKNRTSKGYLTIINNIKRLNQKKVPFSIISVIDLNNLPNPKLYIDFLKKNKIKIVRLKLKFGERTQANCLKKGYIKKIVSFYIKLYKILKKEKLNIQFQLIDTIIEWITKGTMSIKKECIYLDTLCLMNIFSITPNGKFYYCDIFIGDQRFCLGDIKQKSMISMINKNKKDKIKTFEKRQNSCKDCVLYNFCNGGCFYNYIKYISSNNDIKNFQNRLICKLRRKLYSFIKEDFNKNEKKMAWE